MFNDNVSKEAAGDKTDQNVYCRVGQGVHAGEGARGLLVGLPKRRKRSAGATVRSADAGEARTVAALLPLSLALLPLVPRLQCPHLPPLVFFIIEFTEAACLAHPLGSGCGSPLWPPDPIDRLVCDRHNGSF